MSKDYVTEYKQQLKVRTPSVRKSVVTSIVFKIVINNAYNHHEQFERIRAVYQAYDELDFEEQNI